MAGQRVIRTLALRPKINLIRVILTKAQSSKADAGCLMSPRASSTFLF